MSKTHLKNQMSIKVLSADESAGKKKEIRSNEASSLPEGCLVVPMVVLEKPEPIKRRRKAR